MSNSTMSPRMKMPYTAVYFASSITVSTSQQIQEGEQEHPDRVHHAPIDSEDLYGTALRRCADALEGLDEEVNEGRQARDDVGPVDARQQEVRACGRVRGKRETRSEEFVPLEHFDQHEECSEDERRDEGGLERHPVPLPRERDGEEHRQSARQQENRVESADEDVVHIPGLGPREPGQRTVHAEEDIRAEQRAEEGNLAEDEDPHPERDVLEAAERPRFPDRVEGLGESTAEVFPTPAGHGNPEHDDSEDEGGPSHQDTPQLQGRTRRDDNRPSTPVLFALLRVGVSSIGHGRGTECHARGGDNRYAFGEVELRWREGT